MLIYKKIMVVKIAMKLPDSMIKLASDSRNQTNRVQSQQALIQYAPYLLNITMHRNNISIVANPRGTIHSAAKACGPSLPFDPSTETY